MTRSDAATLANPTPRRWRCFRGVVPGALLALPAAACAGNEPPSGGPEDRFPPYVVETLPDTFSKIEPGAREVRFRFSERISERPAAGRLDDAVVVSPSTGEVRVKHGRDGITVRMREGFAPGLVYRVTVRPVVKDMFGNALRDPFDLVFSTGGEIVPNVVAGMVEDRVTGEAIPEARVVARFPNGGDTIAHWNFSDTGGVFSLRYLPAGPFELRAWQDLNRDGEVGGSEPQTSFVPGELAGAADTTLAILTLVLPDTTPPRLARATADDSVTLRIEIDDYVEPALAEGSITGVVTVVALDTATAGEDSPPPPEDAAGAAPAEGAAGAADSAASAGETVDTLEAPGADGPAEEAEVPDPVPPPEVGDTIRIRIFQEHEHKVWLALRRDSIKRAREDSIAEARAAEAAQDSAAGRAGEEDRAAAPSAGSRGGRAERGRESGEDGDTVEIPEPPRTLSGLVKPSQSLIGVLEEAMVGRVEYELVVEGVVNIAGVPGGGGVDTVTWEPPPPKEPPPADSAAADSAALADSAQAADTAAAGDTGQVSDTTGAADTTTVAPDTTGPRDTLAAPPGTTAPPPDTTAPPPDTNRAIPARPVRSAAGLRLRARPYIRPRRLPPRL